MSTLRSATSADAAAIQAIYAPIVRDTIISFELAPPTVAEMEQRLAKTLATFPWLVSEADGGFQGYAYASRHRERAAYQWSVDVSVYVHEQSRGHGVGRRLYASLFAILSALGYVNIYAGIALPNPGSVALHEAMGMSLIGIYRHAGYKLGGWHDVGWWQGTLQTPLAQSQPPRVIGELLDTPEWEALLANNPQS